MARKDKIFTSALDFVDGQFDLNRGVNLLQEGILNLEALSVQRRTGRALDRTAAGVSLHLLAAGRDRRTATTIASASSATWRTRWSAA